MNILLNRILDKLAFVHKSQQWGRYNMSAGDEPTRADFVVYIHEHYVSFSRAIKLSYIFYAKARLEVCPNVRT